MFGVEPDLQVPCEQKCVTNFVNFNVQLAVNQAVEVTNHPKSISEISHFVRALFFRWRQQINTQITRRQIEVRTSSWPHWCLTTTFCGKILMGLPFLNVASRYPPNIHTVTTLHSQNSVLIFKLTFFFGDSQIQYFTFYKTKITF